MSIDHFADPIRRYGRAFQRPSRNRIAKWFRAPFYRWRLAGPVAEKLLLVPRDLRTADPSFAGEIRNRHFGLDGTFVELDAGRPSPFDIVPPYGDWARELHGFGWMRHLRAETDSLAAKYAQGLVEDWIKQFPPGSGIEWEPAIVGRRLISWLSLSNFLLSDVDQKFYARFMNSLSRQIRFLSATYDETPQGPERLTVLISLLLCGLCVGDQQKLISEQLKNFTEELDRQILADGGHISRNQEVLINLLFDLLPLSQCLKTRDIEAPENLAPAISGMLQMLRYFRMGDASLARFNGVGATEHDTIATLLAYADITSDLDAFKPQSGYYRATSGDLILICDAGGPPPAPFSTQSHAGCGSFELSAGAHPIIVNCGAPSGAESDWLNFSRSSLSHSTITIDNKSSGIFAPLNKRSGQDEAKLAGRQLTSPTSVQCTQNAERGDVAIHISHNGYVKEYGTRVERMLRLTGEGTRLEGEDRLVVSSRQENQLDFQIRFHLHPGIEIKQQKKGSAVLLTLPNGDKWTFMANGAALSHTQSRYLAFNHGPMKTSQIILKGTLKGTSLTRWLLKKQPAG